MAKKTVCGAGFMRGLIAVLLLVCIFFLLNSHGHTCLESDCPLCLMREAYRGILHTVALAAVLPVLWALLSLAGVVFTPWGQNTLVQLKVKLSD